MFMIVGLNNNMQHEQRKNYATSAPILHLHDARVVFIGPWGRDSYDVS